MKQRVRELRICFVFVTVFLSGCGSKLYGISYKVDMVNYGQNGVIILKVGAQEGGIRKPFENKTASGKKYISDPRVPGIENLAFVTAFYPRIPSRYRDPTTGFGRFKGYPDSLPEELEVVWQLAELKECSSVVPGGFSSEEEEADFARSSGGANWLNWMRANGLNPDDYVRKSGCTWAPLPNKIFHKKLDIAAIKQTEAYKKTGKSNPDVAGSRYGLYIKMIFNEDQLTFDVGNSTSNPWK